MKNLYFIIPFVCLIFYSFMNNNGSLQKYHVDEIEGVNYSVSPPVERTGAPGETDCSQCHAGTVQSAFGIVNYTYSGVDQKYVEGQTYTITIGTTSGAKNGFEMVILDGNNNSAGSFVPGTNSNVISSSGREYIRHSTSVGINSWSFDWTAPVTDVGDLTVYFAYNKSNNDGVSSGDPIYLGQKVIYSSYVTGISDHQELDNSFSVIYSADSKSIMIKYFIINVENVTLQIRDLSGKLLKNELLGQKSMDNIEYIDVSEVKEAGIYVVSLFIGNEVLNRKIYIGR